MKKNIGTKNGLSEAFVNKNLLFNRNKILLKNKVKLILFFVFKKFLKNRYFNVPVIRWFNEFYSFLTKKKNFLNNCP